MHITLYVYMYIPKYNLWSPYKAENAILELRETPEIPSLTGSSLLFPEFSSILYHSISKRITKFWLFLTD